MARLSQNQAQIVIRGQFGFKTQTVGQMGKTNEMTIQSVFCGLNCCSPTLHIPSEKSLRASLMWCLWACAS
jgi:hypothetical protein